MAGRDEEPRTPPVGPRGIARYVRPCQRTHQRCFFSSQIALSAQCRTISMTASSRPGCAATSGGERGHGLAFCSDRAWAGTRASRTSIFPVWGPRTVSRPSASPVALSARTRDRAVVQTSSAAVSVSWKKPRTAVANASKDVTSAARSKRTSETQIRGVSGQPPDDSPLTTPLRPTGLAAWRGLPARCL